MKHYFLFFYRGRRRKVDLRSGFQVSILFVSYDLKKRLSHFLFSLEFEFEPFPMYVILDRLIYVI